MVSLLPQIRAILEDAGASPRHRWGQNFLIDSSKVQAIIETAGIVPGETILEVGPGTGVLTEKLLESGAHVTAIEIDPLLAASLRRRLGEDRAEWKLIAGDVLDGKHTLNPALETALGGRANPFRLIANLPYQIASPLLAVLTCDWPGFGGGLAMVQQEVAERFSAGPGGKDYGPLGILVQCLFVVRIAMKLPPGCFWPAPAIHSAVVELSPLNPPRFTRPAALSPLLQKLFQKRRKQVGTILGRDFVTACGIDPTLRPEQLELSNLVRLLSHNGPQ